MNIFPRPVTTVLPENWTRIIWRLMGDITMLYVTRALPSASSAYWHFWLLIPTVIRLSVNRTGEAHLKDSVPFNWTWGLKFHLDQSRTMGGWWIERIPGGGLLYLPNGGSTLVDPSEYRPPLLGGALIHRAFPLWVITWFRSRPRGCWASPTGLLRIV